MFGLAGGSYGESKPVIFFTSPSRYFLYNPFTSRSSQISIGQLTYTSTKRSGPIMFRAISRISCVGLIKLHRTMSPESQNIFATSAVRRIFSLRSASLKPRSALSPILITSPSNTLVKYPFCKIVLFRLSDSVVLPEPESPVNQTTSGLCRLRNLRLLRRIKLLKSVHWVGLEYLSALLLRNLINGLILSKDN